MITVTKIYDDTKGGIPAGEVATCHVKPNWASWKEIVAGVAMALIIFHQIVM